jgi:DNA/RNA endonuclease YhcR with UshA esterase domain
MKAGTRLLASLSFCAAAATLALTLASRNVAAAGGNPSANLDQCANGEIFAPVPCTGSAWQNGNTNAGNSHWYEGDSIAYRITFSSLTPGSTHKVTIEWDTTKGGKHALDYLTSYNRSEKVGNDPCSGVVGCDSPTFFPIPADTHVTLPPSVDDGRWNQFFTMFDGTIASVTAPYTVTGAYSGDSSTSLTITFVAGSSTPVLAWGGHIATRKDWGATNSALAITGSPYHMRVLDLDGSGGNQDRSTSSSAVVFPALLTITKTVLDSSGLPLSGPTPFNFTTTSPSLGNAGPELPPGFTLVNDGGVNQLTGLPNNQRQFKLYAFDTTTSQVTITEQPVTGFMLAGLTCSAALNGVPQSLTSVVNLATGTASIIPTEGEEINCTYVNQKALTLTVIKNVVNTNGGTAAPGAFTLRVTGTNTNLARPGSATGTVYSVLPGTYTVTEDTPLVTGYRFVGFSGDCDASGNLVLGLGESKTCMVTNADLPAHLTIRKVVVNSNGGTRHATDFSFSVNAGPATTFAQDGIDVLKGLNAVDVPAGAFSVVENATPIAGYTTTYSGCSGTILNGETRTCTITNTNIPAHLIIKKVVVNNNGGSLTAANFSGTVSGVTASSGQTWTGASTDLTLTTLGSYSVAENAHPGYDATFSADCTGTIALGETRTCTVTNDDQAAHLTINKVVVNNNGGSLTAASFSGTVSGVTAASGQTWTGASTNLTLTKVGSYSVAENAHPGYDATFSTGCTGTIALGESRTCTVTNDDQPARLTLIKHVVNDNGGSLTADAFTLTATGSAIPGGSRSVTGSEAPGVTIDVNAGSYVVTESNTSGYKQTGAVGCTGTLANGSSATCTITNSDDKSNPTVGSIMSWMLHDSLALTGFRPGGSGGTVTFKLYGPDDATCTGNVINGANGSGEVRPVDNGRAATAAGYNRGQAQLPSLRGTFRWVAQYSGDSYNEGTTTRCGDEAHTITVYDPAAPPYAQFITPINGATDVDSSRPIEWTAVIDAQTYYLYIGSSRGAKDLIDTGEIQETSYRAYGLPVGQLLYARLWTKKASVWRYTDITFIAASGAVINKATVTAPANGATGVAPTGLIQWAAVPNAEKYYVYVGSTPGAKDLIDSEEICDLCPNSPMATSWSLANAGKAPAQGLAGKAGQTVFVRLWTRFDGVWRYTDSAFTLAP